jgi:hypothetical protein
MSAISGYGMALPALNPFQPEEVLRLGCRVPVDQTLCVRVGSGLAIRDDHAAAVWERPLRQVHDRRFRNLRILAEFELEDALASIVGQLQRVTGDGHGVGSQQRVQGTLGSK